MLLFFVGALKGIDRLFFKRNGMFCVWHIYPSRSKVMEWEMPTLSSHQEKHLDEILNQKFHYLAKGAHCFAFVSDDEKYVIKFHRFASHLRSLAWLSRPFSYHFSEERKAIKKYNLIQLDYRLRSYVHCYEELKEETGILFLHINPTKSLHRSAVLVDRTGVEYRVPLDQVVFIVQRKASLIYPFLEKLIEEKQFSKAKSAVSHLIQLIVSRSQKGFIDNDLILSRNYGLLDDQAVQIDLGDTVKNEEIKKREKYVPYVEEMTAGLKKWLTEHCAELLDHYQQELDNL